MSGKQKPIPASVKVTVVGDGHVGKTCMLVVYVDKKFPERYIPTVFDNYNSTIKVDGEEYDVKLWDTAGQEDYERLRPLSYTNTTCFLICFSIQSQDSYENVRSKWAPEVRHHRPNTPIILVGTKCDLRKVEDPNEPTIQPKDGHKMKKMIKAVEYLECSAKDNEGIEDIIHAAVRHSKPSGTRRQRNCTIL